MIRRLSMLVMIGLLATACGSSDAEPAADAAGQQDDADDTSAPDEPADDGTNDSETPADEGDEGEVEGDDDGDDAAIPPLDEILDEPDDDRTLINDFDDIPDECVDLMATFLREIEPEVSSIDWDSATMTELDELTTTIDESGADFDVASEAAGCNNFMLGDNDERSIEFAIVVAEREAPGAVPYLEFLDSFVNSTTGVGRSEASVLPDDCDGVIAYVKELIAGVESPEEIPVSDFADLMSALAAIQTTCTPDEMNAFAADPEIEDFLSNL